MEHKLDPTLRILLHKRREQAAAHEAARSRQAAPKAEEPRPELARVPPPPSAEKISVFLTFKDDLEPLKALGFEPQVVAGDICTGTVEADRLADLAAHPNVVRISGAEKTRPHLNHSVPEIKVPSVWSGTPQRKGAGVIVGVVDTGIDYTHQVFRRDDGSSRILFIWDQTIPRQGSETSPTETGCNYGVEYNNKQITDALKTSDPFATVRTKEQPNGEGHGTHVAGIAAGDGSVSGGCCHGPGTYVGVAPEADLIIVSYRFQDADLVNGVSYCFQKAAKIQTSPGVSQPIVVNVSSGKNLGPRDGTRDYDKLMNALLGPAGNILVFAAGNERDDVIHASATLTPASSGTEDLIFDVPENTPGPVKIDIWYPGAQSLGCSIRAPGAASNLPTTPIQPIGVTTTVNFPNQTTTASVDAWGNDTINGDKQLTVTLDRATGANVAKGPWRVTLHGKPSANMVYHAWLDTRGRNDEKHARFTSAQKNTAVTINPLASSAGIIAVAAYSAEGDNNGKLADFSSQGPTRKESSGGADATTERIKPDIAAPGVAITSAKANVDECCCGCCCDCCSDFYVDMDGTSMAAPHVTGVVALMLEKDRTLTQAQVMARLKATARKPTATFPGPLPDNDWGAGKVNAQDAVTPPGGGGGPPLALSMSGAGLPPHGTTAITGLRRRLLAAPNGHLYAALVSKHFSEIRALINSNRRIATVWHRNQGPRLLQEILRAGKEPSQAIPGELRGVPVAQAVRRILAIVRRYASPELARDIDTYGPVFEAIGGASLDQLIAALKSAA